MAGINDLISNIGSGFGTSMVWIMWIVIGLIIFSTIAGALFWYWWKKKYWNLVVIAKIPRSDGKIVMTEICKGAYLSRKGVVWIKRKGVKKVPIKQFDAKRFLHGSKILTVVQITPTHYVPVIDKSYSILENDKTGQEVALLNIKGNFEEDKSWRVTFERSTKGAYSIMGILQQYQVPLSIGFVALMIFIGFAIIWARLPSICG